MNDCIITFDKLCHKVDIREGICLDDISNISLTLYHGSLLCFFNDASGKYRDEIYYEISKDKYGTYSVFKNERGGNYTLCKSSSAVIISIALFMYIIRFEPFYKRTIAQLRAIEDLRQEIDCGNINSAKQIILDSVGNDLISFDNVEYNKISVIALLNNKADIYYHGDSIILDTINKLEIDKALFLALNSCYSLIALGKIFNNITNLFPNIDEKDKAKLEYLYLVGKWKN